MHFKKIGRRKIWVIVSLVLIVIVLVAGYLAYRHFKHHKTPKNNISASFSIKTYQQPSTAFAAAESGLLPYRLNNSLSREAVFSTGTNQVLIAGGLNSSNLTTASMENLNLITGQQSSAGNLTTPVHDSAYATVGSNQIIFGGGSSNSNSIVQTVSGTSSQTIAALNQLRSDSSAVTVNGTTYIIGGYDGTAADSNILATNDGKNFINFANLIVPVRYAAVTYYNNIIYVFGGLAVSGQNAGKPVNDVQAINTGTHQVSLLSTKLPQNLSGAIAVNINNEIFLAGGQSDHMQTYQTGMGTTQVSGINYTSTDTSSAIYVFNPLTDALLNAGSLQVPIANAGVVVNNGRAWIIGGESDNQVENIVQMIVPNNGFGQAGTVGAGSPFYGDKLMIADRGNDQILVMDDTMNITWKYPSATTPTPPFKFYFPDDAFFANHGTAIISNQEDNNTIVKIAYPSGKTIWTFGHPLQSSFTYGYLKAPDDAYQLSNGQVVVADDQNCRVLFINPNGSVASQIGTNGVCKHNPPYSVGSPNGDTPLADGNILISEIFGSWVSEYTPQGKLVWTTHLPISYPSDPQQLGATPTNNNDLYLIADYSNPGAIITFNREGQVLSRYQPTSGPGMLNNPSLVEMLPSGVYMANDDHRDRMISIDPATGALVWQYGTTDTPGNGPGMLNKVDGFDILAPDGTTPTHPTTG